MTHPNGNQCEQQSQVVLLALVANIDYAFTPSSNDFADTWILDSSPHRSITFFRDPHHLIEGNKQELLVPRCW